MQRLIPVLFLIVCCAGCETEKPVYTGYIYFASGNYLGELDLQTGEAVVAVNFGTEWVREVAPYRDGEFLLGTVARINGADVERISFVRVATLEVAALYSGKLARYLQSTDAVIYDDGFRMHTVALDSDLANSRVHEDHPEDAVVEIVPVSRGRVLFEQRTIDGFEIVEYEIRTQASRRLTALSERCRLRGAVWVEDRDVLVCSGADGYVLVGVDGDGLAQLDAPGDGRLTALAWLNDQDAVLFTETHRTVLGGRQRTVVWIYNIAQEEWHQLIDHQQLGSVVAYQPIAR